MEYEIDEIDVLLDSSTNPSLVRRRTTVSRLLRSKRTRPCRRAVVIPEEEDQLG